MIKVAGNKASQMLQGQSEETTYDFPSAAKLAGFFCLFIRPRIKNILMTTAGFMPLSERQTVDNDKGSNERAAI